MSLERRYGDEFTANLLARTIARRTLARFRLAGLAETEISFPSSLLVTEGRRGQTRLGWPKEKQQKGNAEYEYE